MRIVTFGGGTGHYALLRALRHLPRVSLTAIVSVADSGGSSGVLRDRHGILPPGDILKAIMALSSFDPAFVRSLLLHRFEGGEFDGHSVGNLLLAMHASQHVGGMVSAIDALSQLLCLREHKVIPVTMSNVHVVCRYSDGMVRTDESSIDAYRGEEKIVEFELRPKTVRVSDLVHDAIDEADVVVIAPGSLYTSLLPVLGVGGVSDLLRHSRAPKVFVCNTMTYNGDSADYTVDMFVSHIERVMTTALDAVLVDCTNHEQPLLDLYAQKSQFPVVVEVSDDRYHFGDLVRSDGGIIRHDSDRLAQALYEVFATLGIHTK